MLSKVLGLVREVLMAKFFGTGDVNGAYRIAQTGTLVPINFMTSDSLNSAFIPLYKNISPRMNFVHRLSSSVCLFFRSDICIYIHCSVFFIRLLGRYHGSRNWRECA